MAQRYVQVHLGLWIAAAGMTLSGQTALRFEVASVRPADPGVTSANVIPDPAEGLRITNVPLKKIVTYAYDIRDFQLAGGPGWMETERYDIAAKASTGNTGEAEPKPETDAARRVRNSRVRERLRNLLAERFHLAVHVEEKERSVLALRVAKNGSKIVIAKGAPDAQQGRVSTLDGHIQGYGAPISMLVTQLSMAAGQVVEDQTGLTAKYDFVLDWAADTQRHDSDGPSLFTAVEEQLGLRLERAKGRVHTLVVDHIERPSAN